MNGVFKTKNTTYSIIIVFNISSFIISHYIHTGGGDIYIYIYTPQYTGGIPWGTPLHNVSTIKSTPASEYSHSSHIMAEINETGEEELAQYPPLDQDEGGDQVDGKSRRDSGYVMRKERKISRLV